MREDRPWLDKSAFLDLRAVITGGASGIGAALADLIANHGGRVAILDRQPPLGGTPDPARTKTFLADLANLEQVDAAVRDAAAWLGGIDMVANVAGVVRNAGLADADWETLSSVLDINLLGPLRVCRAAFPFLRKSEAASIVNVGSVAAVQAYAGGGLYGASKSGLVGLSNQMAIEWAPFGIRVNVVHPGPTDTPMAGAPIDPALAAEKLRKYPLGRRGQPDECANAIAFLLSPAASYMTAQQVFVSGGLEQTASPPRAWWLSHVEDMRGRS